MGYSTNLMRTTRNNESVTVTLENKYLTLAGERDPKDLDDCYCTHELLEGVEVFMESMQPSSEFKNIWLFDTAAGVLAVPGNTVEDVLALMGSVAHTTWPSPACWVCGRTMSVEEAVAGHCDKCEEEAAIAYAESGARDEGRDMERWMEDWLNRKSESLEMQAELEAGLKMCEGEDPDVWF